MQLICIDVLVYPKRFLRPHIRCLMSVPCSRSHSSRHSCQQCKRRAKVKRCSIGVQCRRERAPPLWGPRAHSLQLKELKYHRCEQRRELTPVTSGSTVHSIDANCYIFFRLMRVETHPNGGASVVYLYQHDVDMLSAIQQEELAKEFLKVFYYMSVC